MSSESGYKVPLTTIKEIKEHPNADALELAVVYGFEVIVKKDSYKVGDIVLYIPIDSIIPQDLEDHLFPADAKIKLTKHRIRQIRIRKYPSQGMLISIDDIDAVYGFKPTSLEKDYAEKLKIEKYEPPAKGSPQAQNAAKKKKAKENSHFRKYNGLGNIKWFPTKFQEGEEVTVQEKIHGTNARAGKMPFETNTIWKKIKGFFGMNPKFEECYGSNNVQLQDRKRYKGFYGEDLYGAVFGKIEVFNKIKEGEQIFGEIYGEGIQKNYHYGTREHKFVLFDVQKDGVWLNPDEVKAYAEERGFDFIPEIYRGPFNLEKMKELTLGDSVLAPSQKVREGIVIKSVEGYDEGMGGKRALKFISEKYLDKDQTDFH